MLKEGAHVFIESDKRENIQICEEILQKIFRGETLAKIASLYDKSLCDNRELVAIETVLRDYCELCKEEGHKMWSCPLRFSIKPS